ncbi:hypothetical protein [Agromyces kandeliae]|uniref:Uncharacterized protein n=1 Tax=Agromyces kandeliae TaxID=2666141 RepID=A0A6L5R604_9MICO|nr:hypothetical protein [Agromyces kandeliae]MRX45325.1 hypothetical protein [Agromyces kandeliae]
MPGMNANLPLKWLSDGTIHGLTPLAWWLHSFGVIWSMQQESDGRIPTNALPVIEPYRTSPAARSKALRELAEKGLWTTNEGGYVIEGWADSQTTHAQMESKRAKWRRDKGSEPAASQPRESDSTDGSTKGSATVPPELSKGRKGKDEQAKDEQAKDEQRRADEFASEHDEAFATDPGLRYLGDEPAFPTSPNAVVGGAEFDRQGNEVPEWLRSKGAQLDGVTGRWANGSGFLD